jgi:hypothetical protein
VILFNSKKPPMEHLLPWRLSFFLGAVSGGIADSVRLSFSEELSQNPNFVDHLERRGQRRLSRRRLQVCEERSFSRERNDDCKLVGAIIDRPREKRERVLGRSCFPPMDECLQFKFRTIVIGFYSSTDKVFRGVLQYLKARKSSVREFEEALRKPSLAGKVPSACEADE